MNSAILENSVFAYVVVSAFDVIKASMRKIDNLLGVVYKYSLVRSWVGALVGGARDRGRRLIVSALLPPIISRIIGTFMRRTKKAASSIFLRVYHGSVSLDAIGTAVKNSRWLR